MDRLFGLDSPAYADGLAHVAEYGDPVSVAIAEELLSEAGIPFLKKERGSGTAVRIITGSQPFGTDFFVRPEDLEKATETLLPLSEPAEYVYDDGDDNSDSEV
ncbi:MAG: DUF2007 domain-containing protein [Clostridia bacterium]|nr:DUF2007 domain-containing protein [Clostridia bacterium]